MPGCTRFLFWWGEGGPLACFYLLKPIRSLTWHWAQICSDAPSKHCQRESVLPEGRWDLALWWLWPLQKKTATSSFRVIPHSQLSASNFGLSQCSLLSWSSLLLCITESAVLETVAHWQQKTSSCHYFHYPVVHLAARIVRLSNV